MAAPSLSTCSPWASVDDLCGTCLAEYDSLDSGQLERALEVASNLLYIYSGRQFPGLCSDTVRPCSSRVWDNPPLRYTSDSYPTYRGCGCSSRSACGCPSPSQITLGVEPIVEVVEVKVDGVTLTSDQYRVDNHRYLVRLPDDGAFQSWPCCPNILLDDIEADTFSVSFTYGYAPPPEGVLAAAVLACELYLSCNPIDNAECRLPKRVQSITRQGVSMVLLDPMELLVQGRLGITEVDAFITAHNPRGRRRNSAIFTPDIGPRKRRINTSAPSGGFGGGGYGD